MSLFKVFDFYPDYILLDDTRIPRPFYLSVSQWEDFASYAGDFVYEDKNDLGSYDEGFEDGKEEGLEEVKEEASDAYDDGYDAGFSAGKDSVDRYDEGYDEGYAAGKNDGFGEGYEVRKFECT